MTGWVKKSHRYLAIEPTPRRKDEEIERDFLMDFKNLSLSKVKSHWSKVKNNHMLQDITGKQQISRLGEEHFSHLVQQTSAVFRV